PARGRLLYFRGAVPQTTADSHLSADRLRAELCLPLAGLLPRPRGQRGANPPPGSKAKPAELHLHRPAWPRSGRPSQGRPSRVHVGAGRRLRFPGGRLPAAGRRTDAPELSRAFGTDLPGGLLRRGNARLPVGPDVSRTTVRGHFAERCHASLG